MSRTHYEIITAKSKSDVGALLNEIVDSKGNIIKAMKQSSFVGSIDNDLINLETYDSPPLVIKGKVLAHEGGSKVSFSVLNNHVSNIQRNLIYALGFPLITVFFLWQVVAHPRSFWVYFIASIAFLFVFLAGKITQWLQPGPSPKIPVQLISKKLNGRWVEVKPG